LKQAIAAAALRSTARSSNSEQIGGTDLGSFIIYRDETISIGKAYSDYLRELEEALSLVESSISDLNAMSSFSGDAADSIKRYFADRHLSIIEALRVLGRQIEFAYAPYYAEIADVDGDVNAVINEEALKQAHRYLAISVPKSHSEIDKDIRMAVNAMRDGGLSASLQSFDAETTICVNDGNRLKKAAETASSAESDCVSSLGSATADYPKLQTNVESTLSALKTSSGNITSYVAGTFTGSGEAAALAKAVADAKSYQTAHRDAVVAGQKKIYMDDNERLQLSIEKEVDNKSLWVSVYTSLELTAFVASTFKVVYDPNFGSVLGELTSISNLYYAFAYYRDACFERDPDAKLADSQDIINSVFKITKYSKDVYDMKGLLDEVDVQHADLTDDVEIGDVVNSSAAGHVKKKIIGDFTGWVGEKIGLSDADTATAQSWAKSSYDFFGKFFGKNATGDLQDAAELANDLIVAPVENVLAKSQQKIDEYNKQVTANKGNAAYYDIWLES